MTTLNGVKPQDNRYLELDALRGFAAMFVLLFHFTLGKGAFKIFDFGVTGVDLFFLISGFVIFRSIENVTSARQFMINRISRLYPTYWVCVTITFAVMLFLRVINFNAVHDSHAGIKDYLVNLTMFQYYLNVKDLDVPYWTIIVEMLFYLVIVLLYATKNLRHIVKIGVVFNGVILLNFLLVTHSVIPQLNSYFPLINHFPLFFGGIIFYKTATKGIKQPTAFLLLLFCLLTQITIYRFAGSNPDHISQTQYAGILAGYFAVLMLFVFNKLKFIIFKPAVFIGEISFALYLIHSYIFRGVIGFLEKRAHLSFWVAAMFVALPGAVLLAYIITMTIDQKMGKKFKVFLEKHTR